MPKNPFGEEPVADSKRAHPFGEESGDAPVEEGANRAEHAARKVRGLRTQMGAEGLTLSATRELIDEITGALDAIARALRALDRH
jgi:hypothetical protein